MTVSDCFLQLPVYVSFPEAKEKACSFFFSIAKQKKKEYGEYLAKFRHDETNTKSIFQRELNAFVA